MKMDEDSEVNAYRFHSLSLTQGFWVWEVDSNGIYTYVSPTVYDILGYKPEEVLGKTPFDFIITEEVNKLVAIFQNIILNQEPIIALENSNLCKNGRIVILETNGVPYYSKTGDLLGYRGIDRNITTKKLAEVKLKDEQLRLRTLLETIPDMIWLKDTNGIYLSCNRRFERFFGANESEITGKSDYDFVPKDLADFFRKKDDEAIAANKPSVNLEWVTFSDDGHKELLETIKTPMYNSEGTITGILGISRDITALKNAEKELTELNASKDKFFSIIAHDLKNPFNTIIGFSAVLKEKIKTGDKASIENYAEMINNSAVQTLRLLENLLDWSNAQRGKISFKPELIKLHELFNEEVSVLNDMAKNKNIDLITNIPDDILVTADRNMIKTILRNLVSNAIKFTYKNGKVEVNAVVDGINMECSVSDSGIGMSHETIAKLFRIDADLSTRGTENEKGTGLGLLLCREFVEKHGGKIWVESEPEKGSIFKFSIPV